MDNELDASTMKLPDRARELTVYSNGTIYDSEIQHGPESVVVTSGDRILAVGNARQLSSITSHATRHVDLQGSALYPGFIDAHAHFVDTGLMAQRLDLGPVTSIDALLAQIEDQATRAAGQWIFCGNFDENFIYERRLPSRSELDSVSGESPVYINHRSYHWTLVNTAALHLLGLPEETEGIARDPSGEPTGLLNLQANALAKVAVASHVSDDTLDEGIQAAGRKAAEVGITAVHCIEGGQEYGGARFVDRLLEQANRTYEPIVYFNTENAAEALQRGIFRVGGDLTVDGSISNWTAAFTSEYADRPGHNGNLYYQREQLEEMIDFAHTNGMQIGFHAIGDRAVEEALEAFTKVLQKYPPRDHRHRIDHFGLPSDTSIARARALGLIVTVQPAFMYQKLDTYKTRLGLRSLELYPLRALVDSGLLVAGSSDSMVSPFDPLFGIHAAVNGPVVEQRLNVTEAIDIYTINAARAAFRERDLGAIRPGMIADFAVLDKDLRSVDTQRIRDVKVLKTIFRGKVVFDRDAERSSA